jgi:hypothetical protein
MKYLPWLAALVVVTLAATGCANSHRAMPTTAVTFSAPATIKLASAQTGAHIACQKGPGPSPGHILPNGRLVVGTVPAPGKTHGWVNGLDGNGIDLYLNRRADGSLVVKCS